MKYYAYILKSNNAVIGTGTCKMSSDSTNCIKISEKLYNDIDDVNGKDRYIYDASTNTLVDNPEYKNIVKAKEKERIQGLLMTPLDFIKALEKFAGITYAQVKELCDTYPEIDRELRFCQNVYRNNPMFSQEALAKLPEAFRLTDEQIDNLFIAVDNIKKGLM